MRKINTTHFCILVPWLSRLFAAARTLKNTSQRALGRGKVALTFLPDGPESPVYRQHSTDRRAQEAALTAFLTGNIRLRGS